VDLYVTATEVVLEVDLAGVKFDRVQVQFSGQILRLTGTREESEDLGIRCYEIMEIERGNFERMIELPAEVNTENVSAIYRDGVLILRMEKISEE
jgi:HSP20 family protein